MPIYEYECHRCDSQFEALVRADTVPECPKCHSTELRKMLSVFATATAAPEPAPAPAGCGGCGNFGAPGGCSFN